MPCTQDFLSNAKIYINRIDANTLWLVDFNNEVAIICGLSSFVEQDFDRIGTPTKERYEDFLDLLKRETPLVRSFFEGRLAPPPVTLSSGEKLQRLAIATPILAGLAQADWSLRLLADPTPHDILRAKALALADDLLGEVQKQ